MNEEVENNNGKKKQIRLAIIGIVAFLLLTLGATFAFFLIDTDNSTSKSNIKGDISKAGVATLIPGTSNLHINLSSADMALANQGTEYYGDELETNPYVLSEEEGTHTISQVQITDGEETTKYSCTAKIVVTMEISEKDNMGSVLKPGDLILQFKGNLISEKLDLSEISEVGTKEYNISFKLTGNTTEDIEAYIKLINRDDNQNYLASKNLKVDIKTTELSCDIFTPNTKLIAELREKTSCLTEELVNGLYRCQGNSIISNYNSDEYTFDREDTVNSNYICLGSDCSSAESDDMYRIIGINEDGEIKVIKNTPVDYKIWGNAYSNTQWPESNIYSYLNNDFYQTLTDELKEKIVNTTWHYGDVISPVVNEGSQNIFTPEELAKFIELNDTIIGYDESELTDDQKRDKINELTKMYSEALVKRENELTDNIGANIGLMNITDYCSSFEGNKGNNIYNCMTSDYYMTYLSENKSEDFGVTWLAPRNEWNESYLGEWLMVRAGEGDYRENFGWGVSDGVFGTMLNDWHAVRPVFFLTSDIELTDDGEGTIENPFRVVGIE